MAVEENRRGLLSFFSFQKHGLCAMRALPKRQTSSPRLPHGEDCKVPEVVFCLRRNPCLAKPQVITRYHVRSPRCAFHPLKFVIVSLGTAASYGESACRRVRPRRACDCKCRFFNRVVPARQQAEEIQAYRFRPVVTLGSQTERIRCLRLLVCGAAVGFGARIKVFRESYVAGYLSISSDDSN